MAWLCTLLIAWLALAGAGDLLHAELHDDASAPQHECAITLFAQGTELPSASGEVVTAPRAQVVAAVSLPVEVGPTTSDIALRPSRGPPARLV